jgi:hypothetical protein
VEQDFLGGVKVVDFGDVRVARGFTRRHHSNCRHRQMVYDLRERRIWCKDCERDIEPFEAFRLLIEQVNDVTINLARREQLVSAAEKHHVRSLAAKAVDEVWRSRGMVPACPCCGAGLFPEDFKNGVQSTLGRDYAEALRKKMGRPLR